MSRIPVAVVRVLTFKPFLYSKLTSTMTSINYFNLLGLPLCFDIDKTKLNDNYHEIQKIIHPDNYANKTDVERRLSVQKAAQINDALATLKNPLKRAVYLLSLHGVELSEHGNTMDPVFLMEQMELRETLSQIEQHDDPLSDLDKALANVQSQINTMITALSNLFKEILSDDNSADSASLLDEVKTQVLKLQFLNRLQEECLNKEEELADQY